MTTATHVERRDALDIFAVGMMILLTFSWGVNQVLIKVANVGYNPVLLTCARSLLAAALVYGWCRWRGIPIFNRDGTLAAGIFAGVLFGAEFVLIFFGLDYTTVARGALMVNTMPFWVLIGAHVWLGEKITVVKLVGLLLAFGGVALVFSDELSLPDSDAIIGDMMLLVAGALWGATTIVVKGSRLASASAEKTLLYQLAVSALFAFPLIPIAGPIVREAGLLATASFFVQAIYVVAFTYLIWFWLMRRYPAGGLSSFTFLSPVFGVLSGAVLLGEPLSWRIFVALLLIAAGLTVVNRPVRRTIPG